MPIPKLPDTFFALFISLPSFTGCFKLSVFYMLDINMYQFWGEEEIFFF